MLFLLIPIAWLAVVTPLLAACVMASRADSPDPPEPLQPASWSGGGLVVFDAATGAALAARHPARPGSRLGGRPGPRQGRHRRALRSIR